MMPSGEQYNPGIEAYGTGHRFYNNEVEQSSGYGMQLGGSVATGQILISSSNPWDGSDAPRSIEKNLGHGIVLLGPPTWPYSTQGVTLDDVLVQNNSGYSVYLEEVQNYGSFTGFTSDSCMSGNSSGDVPYNNAAASDPLSYPAPASYSVYTGPTGPACPSSGSQSPAP